MTPKFFCFVLFFSSYPAFPILGPSHMTRLGHSAILISLPTSCFVGYLALGLRKAAYVLAPQTSGHAHPHGPAGNVCPEFSVKCKVSLLLHKQGNRCPERWFTVPFQLAVSVPKPTLLASSSLPHPSAPDNA